MRNKIIKETVTLGHGLYHLKTTLYYITPFLGLKIPLRSLHNAFSDFYDTDFINQMLRNMSNTLKGTEPIRVYRLQEVEI